MIKANELRKDNCILDQFGRIAIVVTIGFDSTVRLSTETYKCETMDLNYCNPIPITEEILLKCGFKKHIFLNSFGVKENGYRIFSFTIRKSEWNDEYFLMYDWVGGNIEIKYIHQLQNLYFALTGEELTVKL